MSNVRTTFPLHKIMEDDETGRWESVGNGTDGVNVLRHCFVPADEKGCLGLHLSRTPWDPYPWVSGVVSGSCADRAGVKIGDCVLEANGEDLLGLKIVEIAKRVRGRKLPRSSQSGVGLLLWNSGFEKNNLNPQSLSRFANCLQGIAGLLECPVCMEVIRPPTWQCCNGHLICSGCRSKSTKCPICRMLLGRGRCIVADKLFYYLVQTLGHEESRPTAALSEKSANLQPISGRRLPLVARGATPEVHQQPVKLKANKAGGEVPVPRAAIEPRLYHCPSGQPCDRMKSQQDVLLHLQRSHQMSVVQYYAAAGDTVNVTLQDAPSIGCVVLAGDVLGGDTGEPAANCTDNELLFLAKFRCIEAAGQALYWLWHLGRDETGRLTVHLTKPHDDTGPAVTWSGPAVTLERSCKDTVLQGGRQCARMPHDIRTLAVRIEVKE